MRYEGLLRAIGRATARYEADVQAILLQYSKQDAETAGALMASLKPKRKPMHWTQRPENKKRVQRQLKNAIKAKQEKLRA